MLTTGALVGGGALLGGPAGAGVGAMLAGGIMGSQGAEASNQANYNIAQDQMRFQERMSNTSHSREVADLRNAGLNPILSANAGASSPVGASTQMTNEMEPLANSISNSAKSALETKSALASLQNIAEDTKKKRADTGLAIQSTNKAHGEILNQIEENEILKANKIEARNSAKASHAESEARISRAKADKAGDDTRKGLAPVNQYINTIGGAASAAGAFIGGAANAAGAARTMRALKPQTTVRENYNAKGEHTGSTHTKSSR